MIFNYFLCSRNMTLDLWYYSSTGLSPAPTVWARAEAPHNSPWHHYNTFSTTGIETNTFKEKTSQIYKRIKIYRYRSPYRDLYPSPYNKINIYERLRIRPRELLFKDTGSVLTQVGGGRLQINIRTLKIIAVSSFLRYMDSKKDRVQRLMIQFQLGKFSFFLFTPVNGRIQSLWSSGHLSKLVLQKFTVLYSTVHRER